MITLTLSLSNNFLSKLFFLYSASHTVLLTFFVFSSLVLLELYLIKKATTLFKAVDHSDYMGDLLAPICIVGVIPVLTVIQAGCIALCLIRLLNII